MIKKLLNNLPILVLAFLVIILALGNVIPDAFFTGWDNLHPEFNFLAYTKKIVFGAWVEHQGMGAPAAQSQLSELTRLPIIFLLNLFLPKHLIRYGFHFLMLFIGSVGVFFYLKIYWLETKNSLLKNFIALIGSFYYLVNIYTLQQFYISFELFAIQFAFLPFLLITIHQLIESKKKLPFIVVNLLIAPSGHTPTVFYLTWIFATIYSFFVALKKNNFLSSLKKSFLIFFLIFFLNSYWIIPNIYYTTFNSRYVTESRANQLFNQESQWSIIEAGQLKNIFTGLHYLFLWKDFNFKTHQYEYIFQEWIDYFNQPLIIFLLIVLNLLSIFGIFYSLTKIKKSIDKIGIIAFHILTLLIIWMGVFLPHYLLNFFYQSSLIKESFRNPFTKFQIIFSFTTSLMFAVSLENILIILRQIKLKINYFFSLFFLSLIILFIFLTYWPSFSGQFINEKLKTSIPKEYFDLYKYLNNLPHNKRILELPFFSDAGWVYYDWQNLSHLKGFKGYQGIGINFFGVKQPYLTGDFSRWQETNDAFYQELRYTLHVNNHHLFHNLLEKYNIPLVLFDKTLINPTKNYDYQKLKKFIEQSGCKKIWQKNFLYLYQCLENKPKTDFIIPQKITNIYLPEFTKLAKDVIYENNGDYKNSLRKDNNFVYYPFADLFTYHLKKIEISNNKIYLERKITPSKYKLLLSNKKEEKIPVLIKLDNKSLFIIPQKINIVIDDIIIPITPYFFPQSLTLPKKFEALYLEINNQSMMIKNGEKEIVFIDLDHNDINLSAQEIIFKQGISNVFFLANDRFSFNIKKATAPIKNKEILVRNKIKLEIDFPTEKVFFDQINSHNCSSPYTGEIKTTSNQSIVIYEAENYGVNCNGFKIPFFVPKDYSIILNVKGKNIFGRSVKFFINYEDTNIINHDYLLPEKNFNSFFNILVNPPNKKISVDWETRSFGKKSINELEFIKIFPLPVDYLSKIALIKRESPFLESPQKNKINLEEIVDTPIIKLVKIKCEKEPCYFALNKSYDHLWLAFNQKLKILTHFKLNNWANLWQTDKGNNFVLIVYLPAVISTLSFFFVIIYLLISLNNYFRAKN